MGTFLLISGQHLKILGITHVTLVWLRISSYKHRATLQCNNRQSMDSRSFLYKKHWSIMTKPRFLKLLELRILPRDAFHIKKASLGGTLQFQIVFKGKQVSLENSERPYSWNALPFIPTRSQNHPVLQHIGKRHSIQWIKKICKHFHFPIMSCSQETNLLMEKSIGTRQQVSHHGLCH